MIRTYSKSGDKTVGESIKELRLAKGLTTKELSDLTGLSSAAISRWESGKRTPSINNYNTVMTALGAELAVIEK